MSILDRLESVVASVDADLSRKLVEAKQEEPESDNVLTTAYYSYYAYDGYSKNKTLIFKALESGERNAKQFAKWLKKSSDGDAWVFDDPQSFGKGFACIFDITVNDTEYYVTVGCEDGKNEKTYIASVQNKDDEVDEGWNTDAEVDNFIDDVLFP